MVYYGSTQPFAGVMMKITGIETHYEKDSGYRGSDGWLGWNSNFTGSIFYGFRIGFSPLHRTRWTIRRSAKKGGRAESALLSAKVHALSIGHGVPADSPPSTYTV